MRLIDRDAIHWRPDEDWGLHATAADIRAIPIVDAVVVTRCKDCKYADGKKESPAEKRYVADILVCRNSNLCGDEPLAMWPEDFCSYGEPREGTHADDHD